MQVRCRWWCVVVMMGMLASRAVEARERWTVEEARAWQQRTGWLVGCNYIPRSAINQLEMWQAESFDPRTIEQELGWAQELGFNSVRVFLHDQLWQQDAEGFCQRLDQFLEIAARHKIGVMFVLFDGVWDPHPKLGTQPAPRPHLHNSGWVQSPGAEILADEKRLEALEPYVVGVIGRYRDDPRVQVWDLFNEADNPNTNSYGKVELANKEQAALGLLRKAFEWARGANPAAPLTTGLWWHDWSSDERMSEIDRCMTSESDVISFHTYDSLPQVKERVASLQRFDRPLLCTEFMARGNNSYFDPILAYFKEQGIGAYCWGFVAGKSQTIYPWDSWNRQYTAEPELWFHDIFRGDGSAYRPDEVQYIRRLTGVRGQ
ncbi:MAG: endo-1,4-beta-xylanase [Pirellulales bacterium]|nr:endo-1,4-beta-xylanase [Pirellulales bacterium]